MIVPIAGGTPNWNVQNEANIADLQAQATSLQSQATKNKYWINVLDYGAVADGNTVATDNSPAFQAAINAALQGDVVYIPPGHYRLASTLHLSLGVTLKSGGWSPHFMPRTNMTHAYLRPGIGNFNGTTLIQVDPAPVNGSYLDSAYGGGPRLQGLALNGKSTTNASSQPIAGITITNGVKDIGISDVSIWSFTGDAIYADQGAGMIFRRVTASTNGGVGFNLTTTAGTGGATDVDLTDCYSQGNTGGGYILKNPNAVSIQGCRAEFNGEYGFSFTGTNYSSLIANCNTDRNNKNGFNFACLDGGKPHLVVGCQAKRDGASGTTYAGFNIIGTDATTQAPGAIFEGCSAYVGRNDDGSGNRSPAYAIQTNFTRRVQVNGGYLEGTLAAYNDLSIALSRGVGVTQVVIDPSTGVQTISNSDRTVINGSAGATRSVQYWSRGVGERWEARTNGTTEAGSNAGSDYEIARFNDAGTEVDVPFKITRSTGGVRISKTLDLGADPTTALQAATKQYADAVTGWLNVKNYGAKGDGTTNDASAINAALTACPAGGVVYLPPGTYAVAAPLTIPPQVTLLGNHGAHIDTLTNPTIKPLASFSGAAVLLMVDQATGGYAGQSMEQRIEKVSVDCSALTGTTIDGIQAQGYVHGVYLTDVHIYGAPSHGIATVSNGSGGAYSWRGTRVHIRSSVGIGLSVSMTDSTWTDCESIGAGSHGWYVGGGANSVFIGCRSEWSNNDGFNLGASTGTGQGSGGPTFIGCTTDRNKQNGFSIPSSGNGPINISGCTLRRDGYGSASSSYAAINVNGATAPVLINGVTVYPGTNDDGTGINSPQYGLSVTGSTMVSYGDSFFHAATAGFIDGGGNTTVRRGVNVLERTGTTASPVSVSRGIQISGTNGDTLTVPGDVIISTAGKGLQVKGGTNAKAGSATLVGGTVTVANTSVTANSEIFLSRSTTGGTAGTLSYTKTAGTSFTITSSSGSDTSSVNWMIVEVA